MPAMTPPKIEQDVGILLYSTSTPGLGGIIRQIPEDFEVEEITNREEQETGRYLICSLTKKNWDTHHLVRDISRILRISQKRIGWAGTKDKMAVTTQKISIFDMESQALERIRLKDVVINPVGRSNKEVSLGDLWGNRFKIIIRCVKAADVELIAEQTTSNLKRMGGVPNFFGIQRFGLQRPITHIIGKKLVQGDIEGAALSYISRPCPGELEDAQNARKYVKDTCDFKGGLERFPVRLRFERAMLNYLVKNPGDFKGAFKVLSPNLFKMFVHAYQSYLFNLMLSRRISAGLPINEALVGDIVCFKNAAGLPDPGRIQLVEEGTLAGINNLIRKDRAFVTAPLVGYETPWAKGGPGEIERSVVENEEMDTDNFRMHDLPELASKGMRREIIIPVIPVFKYFEDSLNPGYIAVELTFSLQKGAYATTVLREYMKTDPSL